MTVGRYAPVSVPIAAAGFAREVVACAAPGTTARAKALLFAAGRLAGFAERVGLELEAGVVLHASLIERVVIEDCRSVSLRPGEPAGARPRARALPAAGAGAAGTRAREGSV